MPHARDLLHSLTSIFPQRDRKRATPSGERSCGTQPRQRTTPVDEGRCGFAKLPVELRSLIIDSVRQSDLYACSLVGGPFRAVTDTPDFRQRLTPQLRQASHRNAALAARSAPWTKQQPYVLKASAGFGWDSGPCFVSNFHVSQPYSKRKTAIWNLMHPERGPFMLRTPRGEDSLSFSEKNVYGDRYCIQLRGFRWHQKGSQYWMERIRPRAWDLFNQKNTNIPLDIFTGYTDTTVVADTGALTVGVTPIWPYIERSGRVDVCTAGAEHLAHFFMPRKEVAHDLQFSSDGKFVIARTAHQILVWSRPNPGREAMPLRLPAGYTDIKEILVDPSGRYLLARIARDRDTTAPGTASAASACLIVWCMDSLDAGEPLATNFVTGFVSSVSFAHCNTQTAQPSEHRLLINYSHRDEANVYQVSSIWAPGLMSASSILSPTMAYSHSFFNRELDHIGYGHFSDQPNMPHRFITAARNSTTDRFAQVWEIDASGARRHGPPLKFDTPHRPRIPAGRGLNKVALAFDPQGIFFWKTDHIAHEWTSRDTRPLINCVSLCALDAEAGTWRDLVRYEDALLSPNCGLILQAQGANIYHLWRASAPPASGSLTQVQGQHRDTAP
jgi:hypothetical protein